MQQPEKVPEALREDVLTFIALMDGGQLDEAIAHGEAMAERHMGSVNLYKMLGSANIKAGRRARAVEWFQRALQIDPDNIDTLYNLAVTCQELGGKTAAIEFFGRILKLKPDSSYIRALKMLLQAHICDWTALAEDEAHLATMGIEGKIVSPFSLLSFEDRPDRHRIRSERYVAHQFSQAPLPEPPRPASPPARLKIGYFTAEVRHHPVALLIARVLELHDRARFEITVYSYGPVVEDEMRTRIKSGVDRFLDVAAGTDQQIAELARRDGIDIAIDLTGHTTYARTGIFAFRAAPVQISYLGYPGTSGAPFIDYIVADRNLIPEDQLAAYTEAPIYLPHVYQAQDDRAAISSPAPSRAALDLPEEGFVFCAINNGYKIRPELFDIWMRLLAQVEGSILWLLDSNPWIKDNLRREAAARGVDPARLVFADWKPHADYLAQLGQADLFLDSFIYNAGATASHALWAGLPVLTRIGTGYPARMASSLLHAIGLSELITTTDADYESLALILANNHARLAAIRAKLARNRDTTPLFDSALFTRHLEDGYVRAHRRWLAGDPPARIDVPDLSAGADARA